MNNLHQTLEEESEGNRNFDLMRLDNPLANLTAEETTQTGDLIRSWEEETRPDMGALGLAEQNFLPRNLTHQRNGKMDLKLYPNLMGSMPMGPFETVEFTNTALPLDPFKPETNKSQTIDFRNRTVDKGSSISPGFRNERIERKISSPYSQNSPFRNAHSPEK